MSAEYRIEVVGGRFIVIDPWDKQVGVYSSEAAAEENIARCKKQDEMRETAWLLWNTAVKAHMEIHGVDHETSCQMLKEAAGID